MYLTKIQSFNCLSQIVLEFWKFKDKKYQVLENLKYKYIRGGADKSLARPTSQCYRTESIVSLERGLRSCAELQVFSCCRG